MKDIIKWLREVEHLACEFYLRSATYFGDDPRLKKFLMKTAEEESWHYHVMGSATEFLAAKSDLMSMISVDKETDKMFKTFFADMKTGFENKTVSEEELIEIHDRALEAGLEVHLITDSGKTEFHGEPTNTCLAIGPDEADKINAITGHLQLL